MPQSYATLRVRHAPRKAWLGAAIVAALATALFGYEAAVQPHFADESAFTTQSYFLGLLTDDGRADPAWLEYPAYDLPPLPKYLIGLGLRAGGVREPGRSRALAWYRDINHVRVANDQLAAARVPMVVVGVLGVLAMYAVGAVAAGWRAGLLSALLLLINPLYRLHAGRAMADVPAEAFVLATLALGLLAWRELLAGRWGWWRSGLAGVGLGLLGGLAVLSKLNGGLGLMVLAAWTGLGVVLPGFAIGPKARLATTAIIAAIVAFVTFVAFNPFVTAPLPVDVPSEVEQTVGRSLADRTLAIIRHRAGVSDAARDQFPKYALRTPEGKGAVLAVQGFGRFGPFGPPHDSTAELPRFAWSLDFGAVVWLPWVLIGAVWSAWSGRRQLAGGRPPTDWALLAWWVVALATVGAFLPLAWDRYLLPIQSGSAMLASVVVVGLAGRWSGRPDAEPLTP